MNRCPLCHADTAGRGSLHFASSCKAMQRLVIWRHDHINRGVYKFALDGGNDSHLEPQLASESDVPDLVIHFPGEDLFLDVSVTDPSCPSYAQGASDPNNPGNAARQRAQLKENRYLQKARELGASFSPFVMEMFGAFDKNAMEVVKKLVSSLIQWGVPEQPSDIMRRVVCGLAIRMHWGTAKIVNEAMCRAQRKILGIVLEDRRRQRTRGQGNGRFTR